MNVILSLARSVDPSELEETTSDFILSLLDADEHLDIKINRFGGSTTPAICGKHVLHWGWIVLDGTRFETKFTVPAMCKKSDRSISIK